MKTIILVLTVLFSTSLFAQIVTVKDKYSEEAIFNVAIFNADHSITGLTDYSGKFKLPKLSTSDTLIFQHLSYNTLKLSYAELKDNEFIVLLDAKSHGLDEFIISANKWEQKLEEVSMQISVLKAKEAGFYQPQTSADLLNISNTLFLQKSQLGGGSPMIRGFAANRVLIVFDGVRMNNIIFRSGNLQNTILIDPNSIEEAEILFGPGSVIYGSDALGGVLDFHSKDIHLSEDSAHYSANGMFRYSTASKERTKHIDFTYESKKWASYTSYSHSFFDDLMMGKDVDSSYLRMEYVQRENNKDTILKNDNPYIQKFSGYSQHNFLQKFKVKLSKNWNAQYLFNYTTSSDSPRYDKLSQYSKGHLKFAEWSYGPQKWMMNQVQLFSKKKTLLMDFTKVIIDHQKMQESRIKRKYQKDVQDTYVEDINIYSINLDLSKVINSKNTLTYGLEAIHNKEKSTAFATNLVNSESEVIGSRYPNGNNFSNSAGLFAHWKWKPISRLVFQTGIRYSYYQLHSDFIDRSLYEVSPLPENIDLENNSFSASIGGVYHTLDKLKFSFNLSSGFRSPNLDDIGKIFEAEPGNMVVINPELKPEHAYNADFGILYQPNASLEIQFTSFYSILKDVMVRADYSILDVDSVLIDDEWIHLRAVVNAGSGNIFGISSQLKYHFTENLSTRLYYTWMQGEDGNGNPLRHVSPTFGSWYLDYENNKWKASAYVLYNGEISYENLESSQRNKPHLYMEDENGNPYSPSWYTLNFKMAYTYNKYLSFNLGIENILDKGYRPYSSGIVASGRNFIGTLNFRIP